MPFLSRLLITSLSTLALVLLPLVPAPMVSAQGTFGNFEAPLPGVGRNTSIDAFVNNDRPLTRYVGFVVNIMTAGIVAIGVISIVIGGFLYLTAGAEPKNVDAGKTWIKAALLGILLALTAWLILNTINPQITNTNI